MSSAVEAAQKAMEACKSAVELAKATLKTNQALVEDYNDRLEEWEEKKSVADQKWNTENSARQTAQRNWDNNTGEYSYFQTEKNNISNEERLFNNCVEWVAVRNDYCRDDFGEGWQRIEGSESGHGCRWGQGKSKCKRQQWKADVEFNNWKTNQPNKRPQDYNEPKFSEVRPDKPAQNQTSIPINCCGNTVNIVGSEVDTSSFTQQCQGEIDQAKVKQQEEAQAAAQAATPVAAPVAPAAPQPVAQPAPQPVAQPAEEMGTTKQMTTTQKGTITFDLEKIKSFAFSRDGILIIGIVIFVIILLFIISSISS